MRVITQILIRLIPEVYHIFINNIIVRGPENTYNNIKLKGFLGIRKFMIEYITNLDRVLVNIKLVEYIINGKKS